MEMITHRYRITGYDKDGAALFGPVEVDAPTADIAKMYATAALKRLAEGEAILRRCARINAEEDNLIRSALERRATREASRCPKCGWLPAVCTCEPDTSDIPEAGETFFKKARLR
jgi:hypothetical protein